MENSEMSAVSDKVGNDKLVSINEIVLSALERNNLAEPLEDVGLKHLREMGYFFPRWLDDRRWAAVMPFIFTTAIVWGYRSWRGMTYEDRWCYHEPLVAFHALKAWDGSGDPEGWHRHPYSGRRRDANGREWIQL